MRGCGSGGSSSSSSCGRGNSRGSSVMRGRLLGAVALLALLSLGSAQQQLQGSSDDGSSDADGHHTAASTPQLRPSSRVTTAAAAAADNSSAPTPPASDAGEEILCQGLSLSCLRSGAWLSSGSEAAAAGWFVIFIGTAFAVISIILLSLGLVDLRYASLSCSCMPTWALPLSQALLAIFWLLLIPLTAYLISRDVLVMIVYLVFACLATAAHALLLAAYIRRAAQRRALEQPRQQLLTARDKADRKKHIDEEAPNPFNAPSLGVIPGTSNMGYILWLPPDNSSSRGEDCLGGLPSPVIPPHGDAGHGYQAAPSPTELTGRQSLEARARLMPKTAQQS